MAQSIEAIDVDVPVSVAYDQWTQFEEFPKFLDEVQSIQQLTDVLTLWRVKVGPVEEQFEAAITEQHKDERVAWNSTGGTVDHAGVVTFHKLSDTTSRVTVQIDWEPKGILEKLSGSLGVDNHAIKKDLKNFKQYIESKGTADGAWTGDIKA